jgi:hypothetical protein
MTEPISTPHHCPVSGTPGLPVRRVTLKALLRPDALRRLEGDDYRFCPAPACDVVYFDHESDSLFLTGHLTVAVGEKNRNDGRSLVCYCFGFTQEDLRLDVAAFGTSDIPRIITEHVRAGRCGCEVRNPRGACCLEDLPFALRRAQAEASLR